jgi:hypothetical protein
MTQKSAYAHFFLSLFLVFVFVSQYEVRAMESNPAMSKIPENELTFLNKFIEFTDILCDIGGSGGPVKSGDLVEYQLFCGKEILKITHIDYLKRIWRYALRGGFGNPDILGFDESKALLIVALIYLDRLTKKVPSIFNIRSFHRVFFMAIMMAIKFYNDHSYKNAYHANVAGVPIEELNDLEINFLKLIDFDLIVSAKELEEILEKILH